MLCFSEKAVFHQPVRLNGSVVLTQKTCLETRLNKNNFQNPPLLHQKKAINQFLGDRNILERLRPFTGCQVSVFFIQLPPIFFPTIRSRINLLISLIRNFARPGKVPEGMDASYDPVL